MIHLSFIIVNYNAKDYIIKCIESIHQYVEKNLKYEIIVIDNNSKDGSKEYFSSEKSIKYIYLENNNGFGIANNIGVAIAQGEILSIINPDAMLTENTNILGLYKTIKRTESVGQLSCKILNSDLSIQSLGYRFPNIFNAVLRYFLFWNFRYVKNIRLKGYKNKGLYEVDWVNGCFFLIKKTLFESIGGFDENIFLDAEDLDLSTRIKMAGFYNLVDDRSEIIHHLAKTRGDFKISEVKKRVNMKISSNYYTLRKNNLTKFPRLLCWIHTVHLYFLFIIVKIKNKLLQY